MRIAAPILLLLLCLLLLLVASSSSSAAAAAEDDDPDPPAAEEERPVLFQYPDVQTSLAPGAVSEGHEDDLRLWCESWRLAGEANNLAPWKTIPAECAVHVRDYMNGRAYLFDLEMVSREAAAYARSVEMGGDGRDAWVFDVDETLISNLPYYADHHYGLEVFEHHEFDKWVTKGRAPPLAASLKLYEEIIGMGYKVFLLTGRGECQRGVTVENLTRAGFRDWERLILRGKEDQRKAATVYKSEKRCELVKEGFRLFGNSGDQWSDLLGYATSNRSFKLPNPMYYIP